MNKQIEKVYIEAVTARVAASNHTAWGAADSVAVVEAVADAAYLGEGNEGFDAIREVVTAVVNPSAFAQVLEKLDSSSPLHISRPGKGSRGSNDALASLRNLR